MTNADSLLSGVIGQWEATAQPSDEVAALYKTRGGVRLEQGQAQGAFDDLSKALKLMESPSSKTEVAEIQRTYQLRARADASLGLLREQLGDLSAAISLLDKLDAIEATNPYLFADRARARMIAGAFAGAAEDAETAAAEFQATGDKIRRTLAVADGALASYGAGDVTDGVEKMRSVFKTKRMLATTNPDDIALLQELSRRDAELHIAYAAHLHAAGQAKMAAQQWESGCVRLETYVVDGRQRFEDELALRERETELAQTAGRSEVLRAKAAQPAFELGEIGDLRARFNGLDPKSPTVTQRPARSYFWYRTSEGDVERRDAGNPLRSRDEDIAIGLSCSAFRDPAWLARYRPEWPPSLAKQVAQYAADVRQPDYLLPPKGSPPTRGELEF